MMTRSHLLGLLVAMAACGDDGGGTVADAAVGMDGPTNKVVEIGCPATPAATVMTVNTTDAYMPMATPAVPVGGIVKFVMSTFHNVAPTPIGTSDPGLEVGFGATKCLKFNSPGTFGFFCTAHSFAGTITVQ
jgi:plastocyanin